MGANMSRRDFLKATGATGVAAAAGLGVAMAARGAQTAPKEMPRIKLGALEVSRFILGSNQFFGFAHSSGERARAMKEYYTDERIVAIMDEAAALGITAVVAPVYARWIALWKKYAAGGGKLKSWISQPDKGELGTIEADIDASAKNGAAAVWIQGHQVEETLDAGKGDVIKGWVEHMKKVGLVAGLASHRPHVLPECEKRGYGADFYAQCCYIPDEYKPEQRDKAMETIKALPKPVIAYKVMAAARNKPEEAFQFVFKHIRPGDGVCVGVFPGDKPGILQENVSLVLKHSAK